MSKKKGKTASTKEAQEESGELYYVVNIYDNHGTINIKQTGKPGQPPPPPFP